MNEPEKWPDGSEKLQNTRKSQEQLLSEMHSMLTTVMIKVMFFELDMLTKQEEPKPPSPKRMVMLTLEDYERLDEFKKIVEKKGKS